MTKRLFWTAILFLISTPVIAQIATPHLDISQKSDMAAAASWRFNSVVAVGYQSGSGNIYENDQDFADYKQTSNELLLALQLYDLTFEYASTPNFERKTNVEATNQEVTTESARTQINLAYRINEHISVGINYNDLIFDSSSDAVFGGMKHESGVGSEKSYGTGLSLRFFDNLFIAYGVEEVTHQVDGYDDNKWQNQYMALALLTFSGIRAEYAVINSPESKPSGAWGHNESNEVQMTLEWEFDTWLISYQKRDYTIKASDGEETKYEYITYGLGFGIGPGFSVYLSGTTGSDSAENIDTTSYRAALAYIY